MPANTAKKTEKSKATNTRKGTRRVRLSVEERRAQLLELGLKAFSDNRYEQVSMEEIARQANISQGLLFHYFGTKQDFYVAVLNIISERFTGEVFRPDITDPFTLVVNGLKQYFRFMQEHSSFFRVLYEGDNGGIPKAQALVERTRELFIQLAKGYLAPLQGEDAILQRSIIFGWSRFVEGLAFDWLLHRDLSLPQLVAIGVRAIVQIPGIPDLPGFEQITTADGHPRSLEEVMRVTGGV